MALKREDAAQQVSSDVTSDSQLFDTNQLLKPTQAAAFLGISVRTLRRMREDGELIPVFVRSLPRYRRASLIRYIDEREIA